MKKIFLLIMLFFLVSCEKQVQIETQNTVQGPIKNKFETYAGNTVEKTGSFIVSHTGMSLPIQTSEIQSGVVQVLTGKDISSTPLIPQKVLQVHSEKGVIPNDDESITKYVNDKIHFTQINYIPKNLVKIASDYVTDTKGNQMLRKESNTALQKLAQDFYQKFGVKFVIVSAYRSYNYQVGIKNRGCSDTFCSKPGYSEHQSGLAFDMFEATSKDDFLNKPDLKKYFEWMGENAYKYGFNNSYQNGKEIDGYAIEPWHWRYLGIDFAKELYQKNMTYGAYFRKYGQK